MKFRHEWKHNINQGDMIILRQRLGAIMKPDNYAVDGRYFIRSLYFDTPADTALREKIDGVNKREKFRIRFYNFDSSVIHLEKRTRFRAFATKSARTSPKTRL